MKMMFSSTSILQENRETLGLLRNYYQLEVIQWSLLLHGRGNGRGRGRGRQAYGSLCQEWTFPLCVYVEFLSTNLLTICSYIPTEGNYSP